MNGTEQVTAEWIVSALVSGRFAEKLEAQRLLEDETVACDRAEVRAKLLRLVGEDYGPKRQAPEDAPDPAGVRCWLLSSLGRLPAEGDEPDLTLRRHVDSAYEPDRWARYWALEGLVRRDPGDLATVCRPIAERDPDPLPRLLAAAVLARAGDAEQQKLIRGILGDPAETEEANALKWAVLRALRQVPLGFAVRRICGFVEKPTYGDLTYDAIAALGHVPLASAQAEDAGLVLSAFITRHRRFQFWDAMRIRAIDSLGRLRIESTAPLLLEELTDLNPAVARASALALEAVLGPATAVARILEQLSKRGDRELARFARGLREMRGQQAIADELGAAMVSHGGLTQQYAQRLLGEIGGATAFDKLRSLTKSTERYLSILERADERLRELFEQTMAEARTGFRAVIAMDMIVFGLGVLLIGLSAWLAIREAQPFSSWATWITGAGGVLATVYGRFIAQPRAQVEASVRYLSGLKAVFLGYLRQLRQTDQAFTLRVFEDKPLDPVETKAFNAVIEETMEKAIRHLTAKVSEPKDR
jgi:HEAT repeat protein